ncbi:MAG: DUF1735 domain-containing protein [Prevotellaceae bacterium]|nr:DUF1735 domain-containing protein [Prevotellaceae bacterium]
MKNIYIKYCAIAILTIFGFSSCLDEEGVFKDNGSSGIVELALPARTTSTPFAVKVQTIEVQDVIELPVEVNYTGVNPAPQDIEVELAIVDAAVAIYDPSGETLALPSSNYELPTSNVIIIPKGQKKATYIIKLKPKTFDLTKLYVLAVKIVRASSGTISGNYSTGIYSLPVKSPWQGTYTVNYRWYKGGGYGTADETYTEVGVTLTTYAPGVLEARYLAYWFNGYTRYTIYPTSVGVLAYSGAVLNTGIIDSEVDTNTLTFRVRYWFVSPTGYEVEETYTRTGD